MKTSETELVTTLAEAAELVRQAGYTPSSGSWEDNYKICAFSVEITPGTYGHPRFEVSITKQAGGQTDAEFLNFLLADAPPMPKDNRGWIGKPVIVRPTYATEDGAFVGYGPIKTRDELEKARASHAKGFPQQFN